jgi:hypothetical protein
MNIMITQATTKAIGPRFIGISILCGALGILAGCAGLSQPAPGDVGYLHQKIEKAVGSARCIKRMVILNQKGHTLIITLQVPGSSEEADCLKAMKALSLDPEIPAVDAIVVSSEQMQDIKLGSQLLRAGLSGAVQGAAGVRDPSSSQQSREEVISFSCKATRSALLKGEEPEIFLRNKVYVSGPYTGQRSDSLWLHNSKK